MRGTIRRYPGAQPFSANQKRLFFGRNKDIEGIVELINIEQSVVLYSKSGLGKSSLINAGVIPKLEEENNLIPFTLRFGAHTKDKKDDPLSITIARLSTHGKSAALEKLIPDENSLWYHLKSMQLVNNEKRGYLLIFDQFEELFTYPTRYVNEFGKQLAELLYTTIPARFREVMAKHMDGDADQQLLTTEEMRAIHKPFEIRVLMAIRSDRMSLLNQLTDYLPNILMTCKELLPLDIEQAEDAILTPAYLPGDEFASPTFDYSDAAIEKTLDFLTENNTQSIASFQLQILCEAVERKVIEQNLKVVEVEHLGDIESLYKNYYDNQIATIASPEGQLAARRLIEEGLIFDEEERRLTLYEGQIFKTFNITPELLRSLVNCHLLRSEPSTQGEGFNYEISHDSLVAPILKSKAKRIAREAQLKRREEELRQLELEREKVEVERRKRKRARMIAAVGFFLAGIAILASFYAFNLAKKARVAETEAQESAEEARQALDLAKQKSYDVLIEQGNSSLREGKPEQAIERFEAAREFTNDNNVIDSLIAMARTNKGKSQIFAEHITKAEEALQGDIKNFPVASSNIQSARQNITTEFERGELSRVEEKFRSAVRQEIKYQINRAHRFVDNKEYCSSIRKALSVINNLGNYVGLNSIDSNARNKYEELKSACN